MEIELTSDLTADLTDSAIGDRVTLEGTITRNDGGTIAVQIESAVPFGPPEQGGEVPEEAPIPGPVRTLLNRGK